jgi:hypothetical protein
MSSKAVFYQIEAVFYQVSEKVLFHGHMKQFLSAGEAVFYQLNTISEAVFYQAVFYQP